MSIDPLLPFLEDSRLTVTAFPRQLRPSVVLRLPSAMPLMACLSASAFAVSACFLLWGQPFFFLLPGLHSVISSKVSLLFLQSSLFSSCCFFFPCGPPHSVHLCVHVFNPQLMVTGSPNRADRTHPLLCAQYPGQRPHQA